MFTNQIRKRKDFTDFHSLSLMLQYTRKKWGQSQNKFSPHKMAKNVGLHHHLQYFILWIYSGTCGRCQIKSKIQAVFSCYCNKYSHMFSGVLKNPLSLTVHSCNLKPEILLSIKLHWSITWRSEWSDFKFSLFEGKLNSCCPNQSNQTY